MYKLAPLKIFNSEIIGRMFMPDNLLYETNYSLIPSIIHGRSTAIKINDFNWILIKGVGWNYGGPLVYKSKKDAELVFGLCPTSAAKREKEISKIVEIYLNDAPKVLYYKRLSDYKLPKELDFLKVIRYYDGKLVDPCLLYTQVKCPFRIADIPYLDSETISFNIESYTKYWNVEKSEYINEFSKRLARNIAILHQNNFINDSLEYSNVTMLAEIVDYELFTYPGICFDDGDDGQEMLDERREKEILYAAEIVLQLSHLLHKPINIRKSYKKIVNEYIKYNPEFINQNISIQKFLNGEDYIYEI